MLDEHEYFYKNAEGLFNTIKLAVEEDVDGAVVCVLTIVRKSKDATTTIKLPGIELNELEHISILAEDVLDDLAGYEIR